MNFFSSSSVPCNLAPKFRRTSSRRRPRHASRPFPSLSLSSPMLHPEGCTRWRVLQLRRSIQKVSKLENCLARPCLALLLGAARPFGLHRDGVPRILPETEPNVKPIFLKNFTFLTDFSQTLDNATQKNCIFLQQNANF